MSGYQGTVPTIAAPRAGVPASTKSGTTTPGSRRASLEEEPLLMDISDWGSNDFVNRTQVMTQSESIPVIPPPQQGYPSVTRSASTATRSSTPMMLGPASLSLPNPSGSLNAGGLHRASSLGRGPMTMASQGMPSAPPMGAVATGVTGLPMSSSPLAVGHIAQGSSPLALGANGNGGLVAGTPMGGSRGVMGSGGVGLGFQVGHNQSQPPQQGSPQPYLGLFPVVSSSAHAATSSIHDSTLHGAYAQQLQQQIQQMQPLMQPQIHPNRPMVPLSSPLPPQQVQQQQQFAPQQSIYPAQLTGSSTTSSSACPSPSIPPTSISAHQQNHPHHTQQ